jgi:hypothetical protein
MRGITRGGWLTLAVLLIVPGFGLPQADQRSGTLMVAGHTGQAPVTQINGRSYVAVDALARLMNGSLGYQGSQITLTLPEGAGGAHPPVGQSASPAFSSDFLRAAIETMSDVREWRSALLVAGQNGYKEMSAWTERYQVQAAKNLRLASVAAITDADRNALQLLNKELGHMEELSNKILSARKNLSYIAPNALEKDPLDQKILNCARSLAAMASSGEFQDDGSCH